MKVEIDDQVVVVKKQFDHCQEKRRWMIDIEEQLDVDILHRESFENRMLTSCWMLLMIWMREKQMTA
jgi:hypothetical protein